MLAVHIALTLVLAAADQSSSEGGVIRGRVVNLSRNEALCGQTEVILRAQVEGEFVPVAQTVTDADGNYGFENLPVGADYLYLPGANRQEIHYPGRRVRLMRGHPAAYVTLEVRDAVAESNPLMIRQFEAVIATEPGVVRVSESLLVDNPTAATYVGRADAEGMLPVTLQLRIPSDFEHVTFDQERFGREFRVIDGKLVTGIPWTPGQHLLKFTYTLPAAAVRGGWRRVMDAPCESLCIRVKHARPDEVACDQLPATDSPPGERVFHSGTGVLPAGHEIRVLLGSTPVPWSAYGPWVALFMLIGLITATAVVIWPARRSLQTAIDHSSNARHELSAAPHIHQAQAGRGRLKSRS